MNLIETGKIVNTHSIHGEVKVLSWADSLEILLDFNHFYIDNVKYDVQSARVHKGSVLIKFKNVTTMNDAEMLKNKVISVEKELFSFDKNTYFIDDLIGISVENADTGFVYGKIEEVLKTGANDVYGIKTENGKMLYIPAIKDCVIDTNIDEKVMKIRPLDGLFD